MKNLGAPYQKGPTGKSAEKKAGLLGGKRKGSVLDPGVIWKRWGSRTKQGGGSKCREKKNQGREAL